MANKNIGRAVLVTTAHRGVFFGYTQDSDGETMLLTGARCAIIFGTTRGFMELAETGPGNTSKIGARADIRLFAIASVSAVTPVAVAAWEAA